MLLDIIISDIHLTTLITNLVTLLALTVYGHRQKLGLKDLATYVGGVMVLAVQSYEFVWLGLGSLLVTHRLGASNLILNGTMLIVTGLAVSRVWKSLRLNALFLGLLLLTGSLWGSWLPIFAVTRYSRLIADTIKVVQNALFAYGFSGRPREKGSTPTTRF